jgi:hypothetical protein
VSVTPYKNSAFRPVADVVASLVPTLRESVERPKSPLQLKWIEFLSPYDWQWFVTYTFKDPVHPEAADKRFKWWIRLLDDSNGFKTRAKCSYKRRCLWVRGLEWQKRDVLHFHALIGNLPYQINTKNLRDLWAQSWLLMGNTGFAKIYPVANVGGVVGYVTKYCVKEGEVDFCPTLLRAETDLSGTLVGQ